MVLPMAIGNSQWKAGTHNIQTTQDSVIKLTQGACQGILQDAVQRSVSETNWLRLSTAKPNNIEELPGRVDL